MARGIYTDVRFNNFAGGLATRKEPNLIDDNQSPDIQNMIFDGFGSFTPRQGSDLFGLRSSAIGKVKDTWITQNVRDEEVPIRSLSSIVEYYNAQTLAWENLDAGYTFANSFAHVNYNYYTYYCNQTDYQRRWNGVYWRTSTYADSAYSSIVISTSAASAIGFLSAGSIVVDGEEVYYSSYSGTRLSGITFTTSHNGGIAIAQLPTSALEAPAFDGGWVSAASSLPRGNMMLEMDAQIFVAGASGVSGNIVYYSAVNEPTNYTISAKPAGGGSARFPETNGSIRGMVNYDDILAVLKQNTIRRLKFLSVADGTAGNLEIVERKNVITSPKVGALQPRGVNKIENDVIYTAPSNWIKSLTNGSNGYSSTELSLNIRPTVEGMNMTSSTGTYFSGKYYLACATSASTFNNVVLVLDYDYKAWTKFVGWNANDWFIYNNELYYGASNEIATYKVLQDYDDDTLGYESYWTSKLMDFGVPNETKRLNIVYIEGYISENSTIGVSAYFDGTTDPTSKSIVGTGSYVDTGDTATIFGQSVWGKGTFGSGKTGSSYTLHKFRWWGKYNSNPFYTMQVKLGHSNPSYVYKITHIVPYLAPITGKRIPITSMN